ncbi:MAG: F0F1 ATP synthase subunit delta [Gemmatimonadaceae bacterium]
MRDSTIARNYAEALLELARRAEDTDGWGRLIQDVADGMRLNITLTRFLESPKISETQKSDLLFDALGDRVPRHFLRFLQALVRKRRQMLIPEIASEYHDLVDAAENKVHASVTVARDISEGDQDGIAEHLSRVLGKRVVTHMTVNPEILGGVIVKVGDTVMDGSVRRRLATLKGRMLTGAS